MPINFHDDKNRRTYAARISDESWVSLMKEMVEVSNKRVADIGCGGGIYTKALIEMGATQAIGVDFSEVMLKGAMENCKNTPNAAFLLGNAYHSNLTANEFDIVLERANPPPERLGCLLQRSQPHYENWRHSHRSGQNSRRLFAARG